MLDPTRLKLGDFRHRMILQKPSGAVDAMNAPTGAYTDVSPVWAYIAYRDGNEDEQEAQQVNREVATVVFRFYAGLNTTWRLKYGDRFFAIASASDWIEKHIWHTLKCIETDGTAIGTGVKGCC